MRILLKNIIIIIKNIKKIAGDINIEIYGLSGKHSY